MSLLSPGDPWRENFLAGLPSSELDLELFFSHNVHSAPVALVPSSEEALNAKCPNAQNAELTEVRLYGKTGLIPKSSSTD